MKITSADIFECKANIMGRVICVRINTDEGISGFGEVGLSYGKAHSAGVGIAMDFAREILGMNAWNNEEIWEKLFRTTFWGMGGGGVINAGISAIDTALWDIRGKALRVPVWKLLGGRTNERIRAYASQIQFDWGSEHKNLIRPEDYAEAAVKAIRDGYTAVKVDPIGVTDKGKWARESVDPSWRMRGKLSAGMVQTAADRVAAIREAGGRDLDIIIELHAFTDSITAIQLGKALEGFNIYYYEEPVHPLNPGSMKEIHEALSIPIASGERIYTRWGFRPFLEEHAIQVIQPDLNNTGGITETKKICDMANVYDAAVQLHVCGGPIATAASLQLEAVLPNFLIHEVHEGALKTEMRDLGRYDYQPVKGSYEVPDLPGIGQELSERAMAEAKVYHVE